MEELILHEEMAIAKAPPILNILAIGMAGPTIIAYGTDEQKRRYPPKMLSCEEIWCQGYSEPNAGSDLAGLQTRAVKDGEHWIINGQKVWTSLAHLSDRMMLLARTDPEAPKHKGITYFLLDMKAPGVTVKPLKQITGDAEFNEVYFDNVRVHESEILGGLNNGWQVGMTTLMYERLALGFGLQVRLRIAVDGLVDLARQSTYHGRPATQDPVVRAKLGRMYADLEVQRYAALRVLSALEKGESPGPASSITKLSYSEFEKRFYELCQEILGPYGQITQGGLEDFTVDVDSSSGVRSTWAYAFLWARAGTIYSGSSEIQKNIIGERVLGLPKEVRADRVRV